MRRMERDRVKSEIATDAIPTPDRLAYNHICKRRNGQHWLRSSGTEGTCQCSQRVSAHAARKLYHKNSDITVQVISRKASCDSSCGLGTLRPWGCDRPGFHQSSGSHKRLATCSKELRRATLGHLSATRR